MTLVAVTEIAVTCASIVAAVPPLEGSSADADAFAVDDESVTVSVPFVVSPPIKKPGGTAMKESRSSPIQLQPQPHQER